MRAGVDSECRCSERRCSERKHVIPIALVQPIAYSLGYVQLDQECCTLHSTLAFPNMQLCLHNRDELDAVYQGINKAYKYKRRFCVVFFIT